MMTRMGKIGRLPKSIREELGRRIENGLPGNEIVQWLNSQPEVQAVLARYFEGRPVNEQNLCDWKQSGHVDWVRRQEAREWAQRISEQAGDLAEAVRDQDLSDALAMVLAMEIGQVGVELTGQCTDVKERWGRLRELNRELSLLRRDADRRERTNNQRERWQWQMDRQDGIDEEQQEQEFRERRMDMYRDKMCLQEEAEFLGARAAQRLYRIKHGLSEDDLNDGTWEAKEEARQEWIREWKAEQKRLKKLKGEKHSTFNAQHSTSKEERIEIRRPKAGGQNRKDMADGKGQRAPAIAALRRGKKRKYAKSAPKAKKSRPIKANQGGKKSEGRKPKSEGVNVGLAKETKGLQTEKFADRKMSEGGGQRYDEGVGNEPGRETGAPGVGNRSVERGETDETDGEPGAIIEMGRTRESVAAEVTRPKLTAKEGAYNIWFQMHQGVIPFDEEVLKRLNAEVEREEALKR